MAGSIYYMEQNKSRFIREEDWIIRLYCLHCHCRRFNADRVMICSLVTVLNRPFFGTSVQVEERETDRPTEADHTAAQSLAVVLMRRVFSLYLYIAEVYVRMQGVLVPIKFAIATMQTLLPHGQSFTSVRSSHSTCVALSSGVTASDFLSLPPFLAPPVPQPSAVCYPPEHDDDGGLRLRRV